MTPAYPPSARLLVHQRVDRQGDPNWTWSLDTFAMAELSMSWSSSKLTYVFQTLAISIEISQILV